MKIPRQFKQFHDEPALIIVAGRQDALLYSANNGMIDRVDAVKIPTPHYSDREGAFQTRRKGMIVRSGAPRELRDRDIIRDFIHELGKRIKKLSFSISKTYIFAPDQTKNRIKAALPLKLRKTLDAVIEGNHFSSHPLALIQKISARISSVPSTPTPEAQKILRRGAQARSLTRDNR